MPKSKMHADEFDIDTPLVGRLVATQFPQWAGLAISPVRSSGTDNAMFRLGNELAVRLPRIGWAVGSVHKEQRWLPMLAPLLPLPIPVPLAQGEPGEGYPSPWSVCRWLEGENPTLEGLREPSEAATDLARFVVALQGIDVPGEALAGLSGFSRGVPLAQRDESTREAITALHGELDTEAVTAVWEAALHAPAWQGRGVWVHGDLQAGNLLARNGRLSAVIDFGGLNVGDPAVELIVAWNLFDAPSRRVYRAVLGVDEATWTRGRGWALSVALIALPYYRHTNPAIVAASWQTIEAVLSDA
ncbi:aminoglycoside phosphotransferase family protein [Deinococcus peraridilitoris]|uniref:Putative aminoglycoside phosphotransferase n=1 Tax=Deinococcus peraridilitoris (strain DSM 19664 / LMG 22246 / CIP 109416 / KR-200) TaxID=937777 RepID=L0A1K3_DEIPD|nr:aminoglycoside phosphotransferase family protein [Deinococcus peraridilitoris]AFZ67706.1 putative aminoglycoside phosphotransferase [Deinococcus peraridilitoris DSM 19664]